MDIILGKNGRLYLNESGTPLEGRLPEELVVFLANPKQGDSIVYDGEKWVPGEGGGAESLGDLSDVAISSAANKQALVYESSSSKWKNKTISLNDLSDVVASGAGDGFTLYYDASTMKWRVTELVRMYELSEETVDDDTFLSRGGEYAIDSSLFVNNLCWLVIDGSYYGVAQIDLPEEGDQTVQFQNGDSYTQDAETGYWVKNAST